MPALSYTFRTTLWRWSANASWVFLTVPPEASDEIDERCGGSAGGFGAVKVAVRIGATAWRTSVFPSTAHGGYVLPVKKLVRRAEGVDVDDEVSVLLEVI
jgi:hypothetical protein